MATIWDVFLSESLEVRRAQTLDQVQAGLAAGELNRDDLARIAGSSNPWARLGDLPEFSPELEAEVGAPAEAPASETEIPELNADVMEIRSLVTEAPSADARSIAKENDAIWEWIPDGEAPESSASSPGPSSTDEPPSALRSLDDSWLLPSVAVPAAQPSPRVAEPESRPAPLPRLKAPLPGQAQSEAQPSLSSPPDPILEAQIDDSDEWDVEVRDSVEDELMPDADAEAAGFTLTRGGPERVEELDLAAMVDVALQLVLFFLVTATSVLFKSIEIPVPNPDDPMSEVAQQSQPKDLEEIEDDLILVEIDAQGAIKINHETVDSDMDAISARLRQVRQQTGLTHALISADLATRHRNTILALDAAEEVGLEIQLAKPVQNSL